MTNPDRITKIRVQGMRSLADVSLPIDKMVVLIGDNGTGKSTIIEALEILHKAASRPGDFVNESIGRYHGGLLSLLRKGASELCFSVTIEGDEPKLEYMFALGFQGAETVITKEHLSVWADSNKRLPLKAIIRERNKIQIFDQSTKGLMPVEGVSSAQLVLSSFGKIGLQVAIKRTIEALEKVAVYPPFNARPMWLDNEQQQFSSMRFPISVERATKLSRLGENLANCFHTLMNERPPEVWKRVLEQAKLGLGDDLQHISLPSFPSGGRGMVELRILFGRLPEAIPASLLSDGQLAYLSFVALVELSRDRGLTALDEPETHLHPQLLVRVVWLLEGLAKERPVILSTHSDRLLDALSEPAKSVFLCELDENRSLVLKKPDSKSLSDWLKDYRGLGHLRTEGYERHIFNKLVKA